MHFILQSRAVRMRKIGVLQLLLRIKRVDVGLDDLHFCILEGDTRVARLILESFSDETLANDKINGKWALHYLGDRAFREVNNEDLTQDTQLLIARYVESGWNINSISNFNLANWHRSTLLLNAIQNQNNKLVSYLITNGASISSGPECIFRDSVYTIGPAQAAVYYCNFEALTMLINKGLDPSEPFGPFGAMLRPSVFPFSHQLEGLVSKYVNCGRISGPKMSRDLMGGHNLCFAKLQQPFHIDEELHEGLVPVALLSSRSFDLSR
jgi:ankyrin repeat protein